MQQVQELHELGREEQKRVDEVVATLTTFGNHGEDVAEVAHDARNMVTALDLYCDLLQQPGVLAEPFAHYGGELRLVAAASRRLVDKLSGLDHSIAFRESASAGSDPEKNHTAASVMPSLLQTMRSYKWENIPAAPIRNLAEEILANRNLLAALAGPTMALTVDVQGGEVAVNMTSEDLTRILVNLVKNAEEAMGAVGRIHISLWESCGESADCPWVTLNIEDNGPGIPEKVLEKIFEPLPAAGAADLVPNGDWPVPRRGLGLSITRSIVEAAGGLIHAANRDPVGACFQVELPVQL